MKRYTVEVPIAGYAWIEVDAENEHKAIETALASEYSEDNIQEIDMYRTLVEGHVVCNSHYKAQVIFEEELKEDDE